MRPFRRSVVFSILRRAAGALALSAFAWMPVSASGGETAPRLEQPSAVGEELVDRYVRLLQDRDVDGLAGFLSGAFMIQRASGSHALRDDYLVNLPEIRDYRITDVAALQDGSTLVVRWMISVDQDIDGVHYATQPAPRLSVFAWSDGQWRLAAHANFNVPGSGN